MKAFVYENNIYLMEKFFDGLKDVTQVTFDGENDVIYNGVTDWLYEEEIVHDSNAMWWSPDNLKLAFVKYNDSLVSSYSIPIYDGNAYNSMNTIKYPKPGSVNPTVAVYIYNTEIGDLLKLTVPEAVLLHFK